MAASRASESRFPEAAPIALFRRGPRRRSASNRTADFDALFTQVKPVIVAICGDSWLSHRTTNGAVKVCDVGLYKEPSTDGGRITTASGPAILAADGPSYLFATGKTPTLPDV